MTLEADGIRNVVKNFGTRITNQKYGARSDDEVIKTAIWTFSYDDLPTSGTNKLIYTVPANSVILQGYFLVQTAFAGGTSYDIDFVDSAGAAIGTGSDKLWDGLLLAEIDSSAVGTAILSSTHTGTNSGNVLAGYAAGAECILASAGQLKVAATGTFTAGVAQIIVQYIDAPALLAA